MPSISIEAPPLSGFGFLVNVGNDLYQLEQDAITAYRNHRTNLKVSNNPTMLLPLIKLAKQADLSSIISNTLRSNHTGSLQKQYVKLLASCDTDPVNCTSKIIGLGFDVQRFGQLDRDNPTPAVDMKVASTDRLITQLLQHGTVNGLAFVLFTLLGSSSDIGE